MFIMETNCLCSLLGSCDTACGGFSGNNECALPSYISQKQICNLIYFPFIVIHKKTRFVSLSSLILRVLSFAQGEAALKPPVCAFNHRLLCHLSSAVRPVIERLPSGRLFVFSGSIKLSWHRAWIRSCNGPSSHPIPFISIIDLWWNITNLQLLLCAWLNSVWGPRKQVISSWDFNDIANRNEKHLDCIQRLLTMDELLLNSHEHPNHIKCMNCDLCTLVMLRWWWVVIFLTSQKQWRI